MGRQARKWGRLVGYHRLGLPVFTKAVFKRPRTLCPGLEGEISKTDVDSPRDVPPGHGETKGFYVGQNFFLTFFYS
jgi:hypothetical protein